ncbi:MAG: trypsin-like peptidase domain-containing protein [Chloroflexota bacterium]
MLYVITRPANVCWPAIVAIVVAGFWCVGVSRGDDTALSDLVASLKHGVVTVLAYDHFDDATPASTGTGFFISPQQVVTNFHCIAGASKVQIRLSSGTLVTVDQVAGVDRKNDLAVLVAPEQDGVHSFQISTEIPSLGRTIYVLGSPLGLEYSLSGGLVSATRDYDGRRLIQITAAISSGSSGSPVFNAKRQVYGVATFKRADGESINFAVPSELLLPLTKDDIRSLRDAVSEIPHESEAPSLVDPETILAVLYGMYADLYVREIENQRTNRPTLRFGRSDGSVGHISWPVEIIQILDDGEALMVPAASTSRSKQVFRVSGVDLTNHRSGVVTKFEPNLIFLQINTYSYVNRLGQRRTVHSVEVIDRRILAASLRTRLREQLESIQELRQTVGDLQTKQRVLQDEFAAIEEDGAQIAAAERILDQLDLYRPVADGRPLVQSKVRSLEAELENHSVTDEQRAAHALKVEGIEARILDVKAKLRQVTGELNAANAKIPAVVGQY